MSFVHFDYHPVKKCKNPDTYGEICVKCNKCGRFTIKAICVNCKKRKDIAFSLIRIGWKTIQFYDGRFPVCPKCQKFFTTKELAEQLQEIIGCKRRNFKKRVNLTSNEGGKI